MSELVTSTDPGCEQIGYMMVDDPLALDTAVSVAVSAAQRRVFVRTDLGLAIPGGLFQDAPSAP